MTLHLIKLAVGVEDFDHLARLQQGRIRDNVQAGLSPHPRHVTRNRPRRATELLDGGSIYWVIKGQIRARQRILGFEDAPTGDGKPLTAFVLDPDLVATRPKTHRAFQGWRYFMEANAPEDASGTGTDGLPDDMARDLGDLGLI